MRSSSFGFCGKISGCVAVSAAVILFSGCSEDPGLQERLNRLQAEMQEKDRQLQETQSALEKTKSELKSARASGSSKAAATTTPSATPNAAPQFLPREQVEESYVAASKAMQKRVASELRNYSVENCTQFPVAMPSDEYPYHSKIALSIRSDSGHAYHLEFPVSADATGKWTFPSSVDIAGALADNRQQDQTSGATASNPTPAPASSPKVAQNNGTSSTTTRAPTPSNSQLMPGQTATETRVIDGGGAARRTAIDPRSRRPRSATFPPDCNRRPGARPEPPTPPQNKAPTQTMQSDKDVTIHW